MPITTGQEQLELPWKRAQMKAGIDLKEAQTRKSQQDWRLDPQRVIIQAVLATAAIVGAAGGVLGYFIGHATGR
jgi:hypothetical protein